MQDVFKILRQLECNSSRNAKKDILLRNKDNHALKSFLLYTYNPRWMYGVGQKSIKKYSTLINNKNVATPQSTTIKQNFLFSSNNNSNTYTSIFELLDELRKHPFGSNKDVNAVNTFLSEHDEESYYWYTKCILKDLKIGCTAKTINEVYNDLIPFFEVMLAHPYKDHEDKINGDIEFQLQQKLNGYRFVVYHNPDGTLQFFTRNGVELFDFPEVTECFNNIKPQVTTMVYDGEMQFNMTFNETQKYMMRNGPKVDGIYNIFDVITIDEWDRQESFDKLFHRYDCLKWLIPDNLKWVKVVNELYRGKDLSKIKYWFNYAKDNMWEGIMLKLNMPYVRKRTWWMLKIKEMKEIDLVCIGVNPGKPGTKNEFTLGSITVDFNGVGVDVSGFTDYERKYYWEHQDELIGKTITVQYFEETINEQGKPSLQFPQFIGVRTDK